VSEPKQQDKPFEISKWVVWGVSCQAAMDLPVKVRPG
jgi:hypothetical protein